MKKLILTAAVIAATATGAMAQSARQDVNLSATVAGFCTIGGENTSTTSITGTVTPVNGQVSAGLVTLTGTPGAVICNTNAEIQMQSQTNGLTGTGTPSSGFVNKIHYSATASIGPASASITTSGTGSAPVSGTNATTTTGAFNGTLVIAVNTVATAPDYLLPGGYSDTLRITLVPQ